MTIKPLLAWHGRTDPSRNGNKTMSAPVPGGFRQLLAAVLVNGKDVMAQVESGDTLELADVRVHFPATKHAHDSAAGPLIGITSPSFKVSMPALFAMKHAST